MKPKKAELAILGSSDPGKPDFNVLAEREALQAERKKQFDRPVIEYQRGMGNAPKLLEQKLKHLDAIGPKVRALAGRILAKYPEPPSYETPGVKNAVNKLRKECLGTENRLTTLVPAITNLLREITVDAPYHLGSIQVDAMVKSDWQRVEGCASLLDFTDFAERVASMEKEIADRVKAAVEQQRNGTAAPVDRLHGTPSEEQTRGMGGVITNIRSGD
jgi:hypothetical protein